MDPRENLFIKRKRKEQEKGIVISINFTKIAKFNTECENITNSIYTVIPYDNSSLPDARFPLEHSVPEHLLEEFTHMFPGNKNPKGKKTLVPTELIGGRAMILLNLLINCHWKHTYHLDELAKIILHMKGITLTHCDWLCTNFSKAFDVKYPLPNRGPLPFSIHDSYCQKLDTHMRALFDVFSRNTRILVEWKTEDVQLFDDFMEGSDWGINIKWDKKKNVGMRMIQGERMVYLITSVAQLNFFRWAMENKVLEYCINNVKAIEKHCNEAQNQPISKDGKRRKLSCESRSSFHYCEFSAVVECEGNSMVLKSEIS